MGASDFPTPKDVQKHWKAQEPSVFRKPYTRDKGHSIINSLDEVKQVLAMEVSGQPVDLYKTRSPATTYPDPIADAQSLIKWFHKGMTAEEFATRITSPVEHLLYLILYGNMSDNQRAANITKLSKLLFDEQKRLEDKLHREKEIELKRQNNLMRGIKLQEEMEKRAAKEKGE